MYGNPGGGPNGTLPSLGIGSSSGHSTDSETTPFVVVSCSESRVHAKTDANAKNEITMLSGTSEFGDVIFRYMGLTG